MNTQIEIDLGLASVSDAALAMFEGVSGATSLPPGLFSKLLDALAEEHLRRFGVQVSAAATLRVPMLTLDPDELWHAQLLLGNWLSHMHDASHKDPDLEATSEIIARIWLGMHVALSLDTDMSVDDARREANN